MPLTHLPVERIFLPEKRIRLLLNIAKAYKENNCEPVRSGKALLNGFRDGPDVWGLKCAGLITVEKRPDPNWHNNDPGYYEVTELGLDYVEYVERVGIEVTAKGSPEEVMTRQGLGVRNKRRKKFDHIQSVKASNKKRQVGKAKLRRYPPRPKLRVAVKEPLEE